MVRRGLGRERLLALFALGGVLFLPPLLSVFDKAQLVAGVPLLYLYLFGAWAGLIALTALALEGATAEQDLAQGDAGAAPPDEAAPPPPGGR